MSDCSMKAMKPRTMDLHECIDCAHYCSECDSCCKGVPDHQDCMFPCWTPSRAYKFEQRYQQLEQVVRWMYQDMSEFSEFVYDQTEINGEMSNKEATFISSVLQRKRDLEALGVNLDD